MRLSTATILAGALVLGITLTSDAYAQRRDRDDDRGGGNQDWVELGCQKVSFRAERDTIRVGRREGRFTAIRLFARGGDVEMLDLKVVYAGGEPDTSVSSTTLNVVSVRVHSI